MTQEHNAFTVIGSILLAATIIMVCSVCHADEIPKEKFVDCLIGEAESGGYDGMMWIAGALRNRGSLRGCYGVSSPRVKKHLYSPRTFVLAVKAYEESAHYDATQGCTYWFSDADMKQRKVKRIISVEKLQFVKNVSGNNFFRKVLKKHK